MHRKQIGIGLALVLLAGCYTRVRPEVDGLVCNSAARLVDLLPPEGAGHEGTAALTSAHSGPETDARLNEIMQAGAQQLGQGGAPNKPPTLEERVKVPPGLPGGEAPGIGLPPREQKEKFEAAVKQFFPPLPAIGPEQQPAPGPEGRPLTLSDLQKLARTNSPLLRQAASDVSATKGAAIQAGAYPNPTVGVQSATHGPSGGPSYGMLVGQTIKTMGKLKLAQAAAIMDLENAQLAYHRAETDLMASIRGGYFAVLVAQEAIKANRALVQLTDEVYKVNVDQVKGGDAAPYEPLQVRVFAAQARQGLIIARNSYTLAWKQLAASLGVRGMPPTELEGRIDIPLPKFEYDKVLGQVLTSHTDVKTAAITQQKMRYNLELAEVTAIPDVSVQSTITNDNTLGASNRIIAGFQASVPVPVWDRNLGAIQQARGALVRAVEEQHRVRDALSSSVADAFRRYDENRDLLELYRVDILPKQVQAFRATVKRFYAGELGRLAYTDLIASEQNLVSVIAPYLTSLGAQWQAVVDVANLLQTEDLFQTEGVFPVAAIPNLDQLLQLPCCHPCSPFPNSVNQEGDDLWPNAGFLPPGQPETLTAPTKPAPFVPAPPTPAPPPNFKSAAKETRLRMLPPAPATLPALSNVPTLDGVPLVIRLGKPIVVETVGSR